MLRKFQFVFLVVLSVAVLSSCGNDSTAAQEEARTAITQNTPAPAPAPVTPTAQQAQPAAPAGPTTAISFSETEFNFGSVNEGEMVSHTYKFTNTGEEPLIFSDAKGSCGCTVPKWPKEPIAPGETGEIVVEFNSKNKKGQRNQKVTLTGNTNPPQTFLYLKGEVIAGETVDVKVNQ